MSDYIEDRREQGFTLIELLVAIVVVGILAAVAIVGIAGLTNTGNKSACQASEDAAKAAASAFYANNTQASPANPVNQPPVMTLASGVNAAGNTLTGPNNNWTLTGTFSAGNPPDFTQSATNGCH